ncbi:chitosanase [Streptomyces albus subsp. albus]|nr:chitosanase [Streptomyces albus subsp. albus]
MRARSIGKAIRKPALGLTLGLVLFAVPATAVAGTAVVGTGQPSAAAHRVAKAAAGLDDPAKKEIAMQLVSSAENSSLDWKKQREVNGSDSHEGLDPDFTADWKEAAQDPEFQQAQDDERDRVYFNPAVEQGKADGIGVLGQFAYYDALVMHGNSSDATSFSSIRERAMAEAKTPAQGGDEKTYLNAFLDARVWAMKQEPAHSDTSRVDTAQRVFLEQGNLNLDPPLDWKVYGQPFHID